MGFSLDVSVKYNIDIIIAFKVNFFIPSKIKIKFFVNYVDLMK